MAVIRVSGDLGSGKTTLCDWLSLVIGYENHYTGNVMRQLARERGMIIDDFFKKLEEEPELEKEIDRKQEEMMLQNDNIIVQGRMAPFLRCGFKAINIYIAVDAMEGARRMSSRPEYLGKTMEEVARMAEKRVATERERYGNLYGLKDHLDKSKFDIVLDTTNLRPMAALAELVVMIAAIL